MEQSCECVFEFWGSKIHHTVSLVANGSLEAMEISAKQDCFSYSYKLLRGFMRINKKEFCDFLKLFQDMADTNEKIADILMVDSTHYDVITDKLYNIFLKLCDLDPILEDDLDYYCFDLNFGMNWRPNMITDVNGNDIPFSNPIEVYEYLTGGKEE